MQIDRAAVPFAAVFAGLALVGGWLHWAVAIPPLVLLLFTVWFFRDPDRRPPGDADALVSPVDGRIIVAGPRRVSVFMNVFDVHVCRTPAAGRLERVRHTPGRFLAAWHEEAPEQNERATLELLREDGRLSFTLVAGLVARRIVTRVAEGAELAAGQRVGLIRFGSRVDVDLPQGWSATVRVGQRVTGGESVIARRAAGGAVSG